MIRFIIFAFLFSLSISLAQNIDSLNNKIIFHSDSITTKRDSISTLDSSLTITKRDSIQPIYSSPLTEKSLILSRAELLKMEYKYTGDYLRLFPLNFIKDLGFTGQPDETFLYGLGNGGISFLQDGISYNERFHNSFNLNLIEGEDIDSIEIVPLPRGFLYGAYNNPVSVNFITRDFITRQPYSRIRYYQGANRESLIDGSFNLQVTKRFITSFEITNRIVDSTYGNSEFSIWQGKLKLKYLFSNEFNIIASYNYNDYSAGYSGGVDVDSIVRAGQNVNSVLYDEIFAPMVYPNGEIKALTHFPKLRFLIKPTNWLNTDASLFYLYSQNEQNASAREYLKDKVYGLNIRNDASYNILKFQLNLDYENVDQFRSYSYYKPVNNVMLSPDTNNSKYGIFSLAGILSADIGDSKFIPSIFYKFSSINGNRINTGTGSNIDDKSSGLGLDLSFKAMEDLKFYFGYSIFSDYASANNSPLMEIGTKFHLDFLDADLRYFMNDYQYKIYFEEPIKQSFRFGNVNGLGLNLKFNYWKLLLETNNSYYYNSDNYFIGVPDYQTQTGLYYKDILFDKNLDLKTGFVFYYTGKNNVFTNEHLVLAVPPSNKLDFTLAGEIQKTAIVYFVWQNFLNHNYYITPYYPMSTSRVRFGIAWELFN
jgi:hypothetical protein